MIQVLELAGALSDAAAGAATETLESGGLVVLPDRGFALAAGEQSLLDPAILAPRSKNVSLDPQTGTVRGSSVTGAPLETLQAMIARFAQAADALLAELTPGYAAGLQQRRTSFRPGAIANRALSRRKDDRRLHIDAFPANPVQGRRILRVFANVNHSGEPRIWNVGEEGFEAMARRFMPNNAPRAKGGRLLKALGITKGRQSPYDRLMLRLHDAAKLDDTYQATTPRRRIDFAPASLWVVYTDGVMHAALSGQHAFEQTYLLPIEAMARPNHSPLRILERMSGQPLL